jgi:hypothetical protein
VRRPELKRTLGFATGFALDGFLKQHGVVGAYAEDDLEHDRADWRRAGF